MKKIFLILLVITGLFAKLNVDKCRLSHMKLFKDKYPAIGVDDICVYQTGEATTKFNFLFFEYDAFNCRKIYTFMKKALKKDSNLSINDYTVSKHEKNKMCIFHVRDNEIQNYADIQRLKKDDIDIENYKFIIIVLSFALILVLSIIYSVYKIFKLKKTIQNFNTNERKTIEELKMQIISNKKTNPKEKRQKIYEIYKKAKENIKDKNQLKGMIYEREIAEVFSAIGYDVVMHGLEKGRKDKGIDLIALKNKELILIQCKNWSTNTQYKIDHKYIKAFKAECDDFINNSSKEAIKEIEKILFIIVVSEKIMDISAIKYIDEHEHNMTYLHIPAR